MEAEFLPRKCVEVSVEEYSKPYRVDDRMYVGRWTGYRRSVHA